MSISLHELGEAADKYFAELEAAEQADKIAERITWAIAARECRAMGWTVKATGYGGERVAYPKGKNEDWPSSYFTSCPEDMLGTIKLAK
jgi:hypothetical protein